MKKAIILLLAGIFLAACVTEKQMARICKTCTLKETVKDSIGKPEIKNEWMQDSLVYWKIRVGKPIVVNDCDSLRKLLEANGGKIVSDSNGVKATIEKHGKGFKFKCEADSLKDVIKILQREINTPHFKETVKEVPVRCDLPHRTKWDGFCQYAFFISTGILLLAALGIVFLVRRK